LVKRLINYLHSEFSGLHQAAMLLAVAGFGADILALARDRLFAATFGAGHELDVYFAAFRVPDMIYTLTLLFAANTAIIPILFKKADKDEKEAQGFIGGLMSIFLAMTLVLCAVAFIFMPRITAFIAPGFLGSDQNDVILLSRIILLSPILLGLSNLVSSVIQSYNRFFIYALSPIFYNLGIVIGIMFFYPLWGMQGLAWGVALGSALHLLVQVPSMIKLGFVPRLYARGFKKDLWDVLILSFPRTIGLSLNQMMMTAMTAIASMLAVGSIAVFNLAQNLQSVPLSVVGLSYSVAAFPTMARLFAGKRNEEYLESVASAFKHIIFWSLPIMVLFIVLRAQIVRVVLGAGAFSWADTRLTAAAFLLFSLSILSQSLVMLLVRAFYAAGRTTLPLLVNLFSAAFTIILAIFFVKILASNGYYSEAFLRILRVSDVPGAAMLILPLAVSLGSILNAVALILSFDYIFGGRLTLGYRRSAIEIFLASMASGWCAYLSLQFLSVILNLNTFIGVFAQGALSGILGAMVGIFMLRVARNQEFMEVWSALHKRFWKVGVLSSEPESIR
jgi:putative peptidoglycan lipid II flippase